MYLRSLHERRDQVLGLIKSAERLRVQRQQAMEHAREAAAMARHKHKPKPAAADKPRRRKPKSPKIKAAGVGHKPRPKAKGKKKPMVRAAGPRNLRLESGTAAPRQLYL